MRYNNGPQDTQAKAGDAKAKAILVEQIKRLPDLAGLKDVAASFAIRKASRSPAMRRIRRGPGVRR